MGLIKRLMIRLLRDKLNGGRENIKELRQIYIPLQKKIILVFSSKQKLVIHSKMINHPKLERSTKESRNFQRQMN